MPRPTSSELHVDTLLTQISLGFGQDENNWVSRLAAPRVNVDNQSDFYAIYTSEFWHRDGMRKRAPSTESAGGSFGVDTSNKFAADVWAEHVDVSSQDEGNQTAPLDKRRDASLFLGEQSLLRQDKEFNDSFWSTSKFTTDKVGTSDFVKWSAGSSTPIADIDGFKDDVHTLIGRQPNGLILGARTFRILKNHSNVIDRINGMGSKVDPAFMNERAMAELFGLDWVVVARGIENTAVEGATQSNAFIHSDDDALLLYANPTPSLMQPSAVYTFWWTGLNKAQGGADGQTITVEPVPNHKADRVEIEAAFDMKIVAPDAGLFISDAVD